MRKNTSMIQVSTCIMNLMKIFSTALPMQLAPVKMLNRTNYEDWAKSLKLCLAITNLDLALREEEPVINVNSSAKLKVKHEKWTHTNQVCLMTIKYTMNNTIR